MGFGRSMDTSDLFDWVYVRVYKVLAVGRDKEREFQNISGGLSKP